MIVLIGASASGKTEIAKVLTKMGYQKCITSTTREKREKELDGVDYHFLSKEEFNKIILLNGFAEVTTYQDNFYGTQKKDLKEDSLIIVDPNGANAIVELFRDNVFVVLVKSKKRLRLERMSFRNDDTQSIKKRLKTDDKIFRKRNIHKINLVLQNNNESLESLALKVKQKYEEFKTKRITREWVPFSFYII